MSRILTAAAAVLFVPALAAFAYDNRLWWTFGAVLSLMTAAAAFDPQSQWQRARAHRKAQQRMARTMWNDAIQARAEGARQRERRHLAEYRAIANQGCDPWHEFDAGQWMPEVDQDGRWDG